MVEKRPESGQLLYVYLMISAARGQEEPAQPVWSGALLLVRSLITADQASMIWIAFCAYRLSWVMHQASESVYAAIASSRPSVQPLLGLEYEPHSTIARGLADRDREAYLLPIKALCSLHEDRPLLTRSYGAPSAHQHAGTLPRRLVRHRDQAQLGS